MHKRHKVEQKNSLKREMEDWGSVLVCGNTEPGQPQENGGIGASEWGAQSSAETSGVTLHSVGMGESEIGGGEGTGTRRLAQKRRRWGRAQGEGAKAPSRWLVIRW